jgi:hypothetical protein
VIEFLNSFPSYNENELIDEDGLYTWIMYSTESDQSIQFAAVAIKNAFEVGTLHKALALKMSAARIHGAGELRKDGSRIIYNLLSGTYTKFWLNSREKPKRKLICTADELEEKIKSEFEKRFPNSLTLKIINKTMITDDIPIKTEDLEFYKSEGLIVDLFDTEEECKNSFKGGKRRRMTRRKFRKLRKSRKLHRFR